MSRSQLEPVVRYLRRMTQGESAGVPDQELLARFVNNQDEAAFELLLWRHAALVLGVSRRVLRDAHAAEDAFQATFLALARKAGSIGKRDLVSRWLYKVAYRAALRVKKGDKHLASLSNHPESVDVSRPRATSETIASNDSEAASYHEVRQILDEEVSRLPQKYRTSIILCYFQGKTYDEAALHLGCPKGTVSTWLTRARDLLRKRLTRRGLTLSTSALAVGLSQEFVQAGVPATLITTTLKAALAFATGQVAAGVVTVPVAQLTRGVLKTMMINKLKSIGALVTALALAGTGGGVVLHQVLTEKPTVELMTALALAPSSEEDAIKPKKLADQALQSVDKIESADAKAWALVVIGRALAEANERAQAAKTFELALRSARDISDELSGSRSSILLYLADSQAKAGLIDDALKTADAIVSETTSHKGQALATIAGKQLEKGDRKGALKTVEQLKETEKDFALREFVWVEAEAGDFKKAIETSAGIRNASSRFDALCSIAQRELKAGDKEGSREVIQTAFDLANSLGEQRAGGGRRRENPPVLKNNPGRRYSALANVAWFQASAGDMKAAWRTINLLEKGTYKDSALVAIATALADEGKTEEALKTLDDLEGKKDYGLKQIALAQAKAKKFKEALAIAVSLERGIRSDTLLEIGKRQARAGDQTGAADSFARAVKDLDKPEVLWLQDGVLGAGPLNVHSALMVYGESGLGKEGLAWANGQTSPFVKAVALAGLAEGIAKRQRSEKEQAEKEASQKEIAPLVKDLLAQAMKAANQKEFNAANVYALTRIGRVQATIGNKEDADKCFEQAATIINAKFGDHNRGPYWLAACLRWQIAEAQIEAGDIDSALQTAEGFFSGQGANDGYRSMFLAAVALSQFKADNWERAFATLKKVDGPILDGALKKIATLQAEQGVEVTALKTADMISNSVLRIRALLAIANVQRKMGHAKLGIETIHTALKLAQNDTVDRPDDLKNPKYFALAEVAGALAQAGEFKEAFQIAQDLDLTYGKEPALVGIALAQAQAGDIVSARKTMERIRKNKEAIEGEIAIAQARAKKWKEALQTASQIESYEANTETLIEIARIQTKDGDESGGISTFQKAIDSIKYKDIILGGSESNQHLVTEGPDRLYKIMKAEGEVGVAKNALEWINNQGSPFVKAMALTGLAEGLASRQKAHPKPKEK